MKTLNSSIKQYKPNKEYVRRLNREIKIRRKLAIPPDSFNDGEDSIYTDDEKEAIKLLEDGKELPKELEDRLIKSMPERIERNKKNHIE